MTILDLNTKLKSITVNCYKFLNFFCSLNFFNNKPKKQIKEEIPKGTNGKPGILGSGSVAITLIISAFNVKSESPS